MSFLSYRIRMPRHFDSHASVRSTTHRRGLCPWDRSHGLFASPIRGMWGVYLASTAACRPVGLSYPLSRLKCCGCLAVGWGRCTTMASIVARSILQSATFAPAMARPNGPLSPSTRIDFLVPFFPRSVGFLPTFSPPEPGLTKPAVGGLPLPLDTPKFVARADQNLPDLLHHAAGTPALKPVVDGALGSELAGQLVPLATGPHPEDDAVEHQPPVGVAPAPQFPRPEGLEDRLDPQPQVVGDFPNRGQRLGLRLPFSRASSHFQDPRQ
jgi:hypothetical protein